MRLLFPESPLDPAAPDELVLEQFGSFHRAGYSASLFSFEALQAGQLKFRVPPKVDSVFLYRGWMLKAREYELLSEGVAAIGSRMWISPEQYLAAHHLPNWYRQIAEFTPETVVMGVEDATVERLSSLGWSEFFIKDFVKSLKTSIGSRITDPKQLSAVVREMRHFRGDIEGGICVRRVECLDTASEVRYFVVDGVPFGPVVGTSIPDIVAEVAGRIASPFFSIDVARRVDGVLRVVEVGDGQVSDLVGWTAGRFVEIWQTKTEPNQSPTSGLRPAAAHL